MAIGYDKQTMLFLANKAMQSTWEEAQKIFGLKIGAMPEIVMNGRMTTCAGRAHLDDCLMHLSCYLFERNRQEFLDVTIPHELCHFIAWRLYKDGGHGKAWKQTMMLMGLKPEIYHKMITKYEASKCK